MKVKEFMPKNGLTGAPSDPVNRVTKQLLLNLSRNLKNRLIQILLVKNWFPNFQRRFSSLRYRPKEF